MMVPKNMTTNIAPATLNDGTIHHMSDFLYSVRRMLISSMMVGACVCHTVGAFVGVFVGVKVGASDVGDGVGVTPVGAPVGAVGADVG